MEISVSSRQMSHKNQIWRWRNPAYVCVMVYVLEICATAGSNHAPRHPASNGKSVTYCAGTCNGVPTQWALFGAAHFERNKLVPGGYMIDQIGFGSDNYAVLTFTVPAAGTYDISAALETEYPRNLYVWVGDESGPQATGSPFLITGNSFKVPVDWQLGSVSLQAGTNQLVFGNPTSNTQSDRCPYISAVTITGPF